LDLLNRKQELSVEEISKAIKTNFNNSSGHINKLVVAGLVMKRHDGNFVRHKLTKRGETTLKFPLKNTGIEIKRYRNNDIGGTCERVIKFRPLAF
jgi:DNA-binding transcriptional ArsR family regulator